MSRIARSRPARRPRPVTREVWMYVIDPAKLKRTRKAAGLTQGDVAYKAKCTQQYVSILESGRDRDCSEDIAIRICKVLSVDLEDYFEAREVVRMPAIATGSRDGSSDPSAA